MTVKIGRTIICADGYIPIPEENAVQFYRNKTSLDYMPPIKADANMLSGFGKEVLLVESGEDE